VPYIKREDRRSLDPTAGDSLSIRFRTATQPGELNYQISRMIDAYLINKQHLVPGNKIGYTELNEVMGVLESAKLEIYRRLVVPYEDYKMSMNEDVFVIDKIMANNR
jgi:hypothetical protein